MFHRISSRVERTATVLLLTLVVIVVSLADPAQSSESFTKTTLNNELIVLHERRSNPPVIAVKIFLPVGSSHDPDNRAGLAYLTARMISSRTATRNLIEFNRFKSRYGLKVNSSVYPDFTEFSFTAITEHRKTLLQTIRDVLTVDDVDTRLITHLKNQQMASLKSRRDRTYTLALDRALEHFYGNHPYGHPPIGRLETVQELDAGTVRTFYRNHYSLNGAVASTVGELSLDQFADPLRKMNLPAEQPPELNASYDSPSDTRVVLERDVDQPSHLILYPAPRVTADSYVPTKVLDALLGGGMSSRLFTEMREKRSLGYQVTSSYPSRRLTSSFRVFLGGGQPDGAQFRSTLDSIWAQLQNDGPSDTELAQAKDYLKGNFLLNHETPGQTAWYRGFYEILGRGANFDREYPDRIDATRTPDVQSAIDRLLKTPLFLTIQPGDS